MLTSLLPERINKCRTKSLMEEKERRTMTTLARENKASSATLLRPNPDLRRISKAGDRAVTGAATVILAMGAGRRAAAAIHAYLQSQ